jgi:hypothetical protein
MMKPIFLKYKQHTVRAYVQPDGTLLIDSRETIRVLCRINGVSAEAMDRLPESNNLEDYSWAFHAILAEVHDRPATKAFGRWLNEQIARFEAKGASL